MYTGILLVDKPVGLSTFDLIRVFKKNNHFEGKIGHAGTLDVFAGGLVILLLNTTRHFADFQEHKKHYLASVRLDASSTTLDIEGKVTHFENDEKIQKDSIQGSIDQFIGTHEQNIPSYSAAKFEGKPLYKHAAQGNLVTHKSKPITVYDLSLLALKYPLATLNITCSSGTYVRQLTYDLFKKIGIESFLFGLTRTQIGEYQIKDAVSLQDIYNQNWVDRLIPYP